jgi:hypothetical protein
MNSIFEPEHKLSRLFACAISICVCLATLNTPFAWGQEKRRCLAGVNYPWVAYGHDFGKNEWGHDGFITGGWTYQTAENTQGFVDSRLTKARARSGTGSLSVSADLVGKHPNKTNGEVHFDLSNHRAPGVSAPLNLTNTTARCWVFLPSGSAGNPSAQNGVQIFFKSKEGETFNSAYSFWRNIEPGMEGRWVEFTANPSDPTNTITGNFDPMNVIEVGIKVAINDKSDASLSGTIFIDDFVLGTAQPVTFDFEKSELENDFINFKQTFGECPIAVVRIFIFADGTAAPEFATNGEVAGLDEYVFQNFDMLLEVAKQRNILLIPVLLDFTWLNTERNVAGARLGGHSDIIRDPAKRQTFIDRALKPLIERYCNNPQILAWEVINEPEWAMNEIEKDFQAGDPVAIKSMQDFVKLCVETIHSCANQKVTVGSARRAWLHFWKGLGLDLYQFHWYDKFEAATPPDQFPWPPYSELGLDKPCIIGEVPTKSTQRSAQQFLDAAFDGGYEGLLFWSYRAGEEFTNFSTASASLEAWCRASGMLIKRTTTAKKRFTIEGDCLEQVEAVLINQKIIDPNLLTVTPTKITVAGKSKKLGIKPGNNQLQLRLKNGTTTKPLEFAP